MGIERLTRAIVRRTLIEGVIVPPDIPGTMNFWHGGDLDVNRDSIAHRANRNEYGAGLYLTTHYGTAQKYAKGGRKLYLVTVAVGTDISDATIPTENVLKFVNEFVVGSKRKDVMARLAKHTKDGMADAKIFNNIILNEKAVKVTNLGSLRSFLVANGIDYEIDNNTFGFHENVMVLYNVAKIVQKTRIMPGDRIETFDFH